MKALLFAGCVVFGESVRSVPCGTDIEKLGIDLTTSPVYEHYKPAKLESDSLVAEIAKIGTDDLPNFSQSTTTGVTDWVDLKAPQKI